VDQGKGYLSLLRLNRAQALQIIGVGLILAVGVNLLASYISRNLSSTETLLVGVAVTALGALFVLGRVFRPRPREREFIGFFVYDKKENRIVKPDFEYELGYSIAKSLSSAFAEDASMKMIWDRNPIGANRPGEDNSTGDADPNKSLELIRQAAEYFVLENLSTRVSDHFRSGDFNKDELDTLSHTDIPDVLLQNRFLRTFAEPMEDRAAFVTSQPMGSSGGTIVMASGEGGALYRRFELVLPKDWRVHRSAANTIEIDAKRFKLTIVTKCEGWGAILPYGYVSDYLGLLDDEDNVRYAERQISVSIKIAPRKAWLVGPRGWNYYRWIDEWIASLEPQIDQESYLNRIQFAGAETVLKLMKNWGRQAGQSPSSPTKLDSPRTGDSDNTSAAKTEQRRGPTFALGDRVEHASFGPGVIVSSEESNTVDVEFEPGTIRTFLVPYAPLRLIQRKDGIDMP
jgi:hypothetical protein